MSFLEAKTVNTFIGLVVDVALPLRGDGNDFEDDDAVTRALLERDAIVVIARPPLLVNEPTEVKVVEDDPERSGDIIFFYTSFLSLVWISSLVTQKKEKSVNLSLVTLTKRAITHRLSLCVYVCVSARAYPSLSLSSLQLSLSYNGEQNKFKRKRTAWRLFDHEFFFAILCLGFPTLINAFEERASLSLLDVPHYTLALLRAFCAVSRRNRTLGIYTTRVSVCVCV